MRHPMPYGDLLAERVQRFESIDDLDRADVTIEEREEYEHHIAEGTPVFVGVDYGAILDEIEGAWDVLLFDGGNNDLPFYRPTVHIVVADPLRAGDEATYRRARRTSGWPMRSSSTRSMWRSGRISTPSRRASAP